MSDYSRIEELENALEALLECFDRPSVHQLGDDRPWIEVEVEMPQDNPEHSTTIEIVEGQVNQTTADAIAMAEEVLYQDQMSGGEYDEV
jgi:hypothetical protein